VNLAEYEECLEQVDMMLDLINIHEEALARLVAAIEAYEDEHYPIGEPTWWGRLWFRFEQQWLSRLWRKDDA